MSHYDTLGVAKNATRKEIKDAYRRLSKETHPDVSDNRKSPANEERFKRISAAASVLTNDKKRAAYDDQLALSGPFGRGLHRHSGHAHDLGGGLRRPSSSGSYGGRPASGLPLFFHTLLRPRTFVIGSIAVVAYAGASEYLSGPKKSPVREGSDLVQAWRNPETGRYEQPAPWDPLYRKLNPDLELVPRDQVKPRQM